jgi:hypothetical protein
MWIFTNREVVSIGLSIIFFSWGLLHKDVRSQIPKLLKSLFAWKLVVVFIYAAIIFIAIILLVSKVISVDIYIVKDSIIWFFSIGLGLIFGNLNGSKFSKKEIINNIIVNPLKITVLIQFLVSSYVFPIYYEIIQVPLLTLIVLCEAYSKNKKEYETVNRVLNKILVIAGWYLIIYVVTCAIVDYKNILSVKSLISYFLPTLLTLMYLPFAYVIVVISKYELQFIRYDRINNKKMISLLKLSVILYAKLSIKRIDGICSVLDYNYYEINNKNDIKEYIRCLKKQGEILKTEV